MQAEITELIRDVREQVLYLQELGVSDLNAEMSEISNFKSQIANMEIRKSDNEILRSVAGPVEKYVPVEPLIIPSKPTAARKQGEPSRLSALPSLTNRKIVPPTEAKPKIPQQEETEMPIAKTEKISSDTLFSDLGQTLPEVAEKIEDIRLDIGNCTRCPLHEGRTKIVHTTGNFQADLLFVGEAPGADEDDQGLPFVGRAGQLLTKIIEGMGMKRDDVVIGNINRCRPPGNRQPTLPEAETCRPFLLREIAVISPKVIVVMGNTALHNLLETKTGITKMRGQFHDYFGVKVMPTFHPAYLLRDPRKKREVWEDMKMVRDYLTTAK
ncbi:MAG: uracil-DNA glycosylase [Pyrinomonadaceae bacterium]